MHTQKKRDIYANVQHCINTQIRKVCYNCHNLHMNYNMQTNFNIPTMTSKAKVKGIARKTRTRYDCNGAKSAPNGSSTRLPLSAGPSPFPHRRHGVNKTIELTCFALQTRKHRRRQTLQPVDHGERHSCKQRVAHSMHRCA